MGKTRLNRDFTHKNRTPLPLYEIGQFKGPELIKTNDLYIPLFCATVLASGP